jgi:hypothetical protein
MIRPFARRSIPVLAACLAMLLAPHAAQAQAGSLMLYIDTVGASSGSVTGATVAPGAQLTGAWASYSGSVSPGTQVGITCYEWGVGPQTTIYQNSFVYTSQQLYWSLPAWTPTAVGTYTVQCGVLIGSTNVLSGTVQVPVANPPPPTYPGFINPKYVVVGVIYAPPGASSYVQYADTTSIGNTATLSNSFQNDVGFSVSVQGGLGIPAAGLSGGGVKLTFTESTDYTQGSSSSTTNTISQTATIAYKFPGTPTLSPVTNDNDFILLWLNPELLVTYTPPAGSNPASLQWTGYAMDPNDPETGQPPPSGPYIAGPDIYAVQVGCLNGHISCPSTLEWLNGVEGSGSYVTSGTLARGWQSAANGYIWPAGEQSGLTFNDVCQILSFDPLSVTPSQCPTPNNYTLLSSLPAGTTSDGRFTREPAPYYQIWYDVGGENEQYNLVQTNTQSVSTGNTSQVKQAFSVSEQFGTNFFDIFSSTTTLKQSDTLTWNYSTLSTLTTTNTLTNALSVTGPPDPPPTYDGPTQFNAYQDNTFGTFVFVPVPD